MVPVLITSPAKWSSTPRVHQLGLSLQFGVAFDTVDRRWLSLVGPNVTSSSFRTCICNICLAATLRNETLEQSYCIYHSVCADMKSARCSIIVTESVDKLPIKVLISKPGRTECWFTAMKRELTLENKVTIFSMYQARRHF